MSDTEQINEEQSVISGEGYNAGSEVGTEVSGVTDPTMAPSVTDTAKGMVIDAMKDPKNQEAAAQLASQAGNEALNYAKSEEGQQAMKKGAAAGWGMLTNVGSNLYNRATGKAKKDEEAAAAAAAAEQQRLEAEAAAAQQQQLAAEAAAAVPTGDDSTVSTDFDGLSAPTYAPPSVPGATTGNSVELSINELNDNLEGAKATMMSVDPTTGVLNVAYEDADDAGADNSVSQVGDESMSGGRKTKRRKQIKKNKSQKKKRKQTKKKGGKKKGGKKAKKSNTRKCT